MDVEEYSISGKLLMLRIELRAVQEERFEGHAGITPDELDTYLEGIIDETEPRTNSRI